MAFLRNEPLCLYTEMGHITENRSSLAPLKIFDVLTHNIAPCKSTLNLSPLQKWVIHNVLRL